MEGEKKPLPLESGGASFRKLFVLLINEPGKLLCMYVCVCDCVLGVLGLGESTEAR